MRWPTAHRRLRSARLWRCCGRGRGSRLTPPWSAASPAHIPAMSRNTIVRRQPKGRPTGGQFAEQHQGASGLVLGDEDPWLDAADPWATGDDNDDTADSDGGDQPDVDKYEQLRARCDEISMLTQVIPWGPYEKEDNEAAYEDYMERMSAVRKRVEAEHGDAEGAVVDIGHQIAADAEARAGITAEDAADRYSKRYVTAETAEEETRTEYTWRRQEAMRKYDLD